MTPNLRTRFKNFRTSQWAPISMGAFALALLPSCFSSTGSMTVNEEVLATAPSQGGGTNSSGQSLGLASVGVTKVLDTATADWVKDSTGRAFFGSRTLSVSGVCTRGVAQVRVLVAGQTVASGECARAGTFEISFTVTADGALDAQVVPVGADGQVTPGTKDSLLLYAKTVASSDVSFTQSTPYTSSAGSFTIDGTFPTDQYISQVTETTGTAGSLSYNTSSGTFTFTGTIIQGETVNLTFKTIDLVGNTSSGANFQVITSKIIGIANFTSFAKPSSTSTNTLAVSGGQGFMMSAPSGIAAGSGNKVYLGIPAVGRQGP